MYNVASEGMKKRQQRLKAMKSREKGNLKAAETFLYPTDM